MTKGKGQKRLSYSVNKDNQLTVKISPKSKAKVLPGEFKLDNNNCLIYKIKKPKRWQRSINLPDKIQLPGRWKLNSNHDLVLKLKDEGVRGGARRLIVKGNLLDSSGDELLFVIRSKVSGEVTKVSLLKFKGTWNTDRFNRINFQVKKEKSTDVLTLRGAWNVNKNQEIVYEYKKRKIKRKQTLVFKGFWKIASGKRIVYHLDGFSQQGRSRGHSQLDFRVHLQTPTVYPQHGAIKYRIGVGLKKQRRERAVTLYGVWKFDRKYGIVFEMHYAQNKVSKVQFSATVNLNKKERIEFSLRDKYKRPLGVTLVYKRKFLPKKDWEYFVRLQRQGKSSGIELGIETHF
jgi:hypothetical protein